MGLGNPVQAIIPSPSGRGNSWDRRLKPGEESFLLEASEQYGGDLPHVIKFALETAMRRGESWNDLGDGGPQKTDGDAPGHGKWGQEDRSALPDGRPNFRADSPPY